MTTEKITIQAKELKNGDKVSGIGIFKAAYTGSTVSNVNIDEFRDLVKFSMGADASTVYLSLDWYLEVIREKEKLAQYYFKSHPMKEYALKEDSDLFRNASVVIHDGKVIKHPE